MSVLTVEIVTVLIESFRSDCGIRGEDVPDGLVDNFLDRHPGVTIAGYDSQRHPASAPASRSAASLVQPTSRDLFSHPATPPYLVAIRQRGDALNRKVEAFFRKHGTGKGLPADILDEMADHASEVNAALVKLGGTPRHLQLPPPQSQKSGNTGSPPLDSSDYWIDLRAALSDDDEKDKQQGAPAAGPSRGKKRKAPSAVPAGKQQPQQSAASSSSSFQGPTDYWAAWRGALSDDEPEEQRKRKSTSALPAAGGKRQRVSSDVEPSDSSDSSDDSQATQSYQASPRPESSSTRRQRIPVIPLPVVSALQDLFRIMPRPPRDGDRLRFVVRLVLEDLSTSLGAALGAAPAARPAAGVAPAAGPVPARPAPGPAPQLQVMQHYIYYCLITF